jgi:hypothetical protein
LPALSPRRRGRPGIPRLRCWTAVSKLPATGDGRALVILLGMVLGTMAANVGPQSPRRMAMALRAALQNSHQDGGGFSHLYGESYNRTVVQNSAQHKDC